jgi:hypothetical protein
MIDRRQAGSGQLRRGGRAATTASTPQTILGALLTAWWDAVEGPPAGSGVADTWTDLIGGVVLAPSGTSPDFAADGVHFNGLPVVQCARTGPELLTSGDLGSPLLLAGTRPYVMMIGRQRAVPVAEAHGWWRFRETVATNQVDVGPHAGETGGNADWTAYYRTGNVAANAASATVTMTSPLVLEQVGTTGGVYLYQDGAEVVALTSAPAPDALSHDVYLIEIGRNVFGAANVSVASLIIASAEPSASQRAALRSWASRVWGTP